MFRSCAHVQAPVGKALHDGAGKCQRSRLRRLSHTRPGESPGRDSESCGCTAALRAGGGFRIPSRTRRVPTSARISCHGKCSTTAVFECRRLMTPSPQTPPERSRFCSDVWGCNKRFCFLLANRCPVGGRQDTKDTESSVCYWSVPLRMLIASA